MKHKSDKRVGKLESELGKDKQRVNPDMAFNPTVKDLTVEPKWEETVMTDEQIQDTHWQNDYAENRLINEIGRDIAKAQAKQTASVYSPIIKALREEVDDLKGKNAKANYLKEQAEQARDNLTYDLFHITAEKRELESALASQPELLTEQLQKALEDDATDLWKVTNAIKKEIEMRDWIVEGRGSYQWDDDRYRQETKWAFEAVLKIIGEVQPPASNRYHQVLAQLAKAHQIPEGWREKIAIQLIVRDEDIDWEQAEKMWEGWKKSALDGHLGDCTNEPQTCSLCLVTRWYKDVDQILKLMEGGG